MTEEPFSPTPAGRGVRTILALNWRCTRHPQAGGGETNLFEQARRWVRDGHRVTVVCADPGREYAPEKNEVMDGIEVRRMGSRFGVYPLAALFMLTHRKGFDRILDVSNGIPFFSPLFSKIPGALLVHHVHDEQWYSEFPRPVADVGWWLERYVVPLVYRRRPVVAVSPTTRDGLLEQGFKGEQVSVVYNGLDGGPAPETVIPEPVGHRFVYLGRLKRYKRVDHLVRAVAALRPEFLDVRLDIAGDGDARPELEDLVAELGLRDHVHFHGFVTEEVKAELLRSAGVYATASTHEGWGISVIEANAWGCPAVAYDVPGLSVAVRDGETGLLAPDGDQDGFAAAIGHFLRDPVDRARASVAARTWAAQFDWDTSAHQTLAVLEGADPTPPARAGAARAV